MQLNINGKKIKLSQWYAICLLDKIKDRFESLRDRDDHPNGSFDRKGRFYLAEKFDCCRGIRTPSVRFPYSEMLHARTLIHCLYENGLSKDNLSDITRYINAFKQPPPKNFCYKKVVLSSSERFYSIYDIDFEWQMNKRIKPWGVGGSVYGFEDIKEAIIFGNKIEKPESTSDHFGGLLCDKFAILKCECPAKSESIRDTNYKTKKGYAWLKPVEWVLSAKP